VGSCKVWFEVRNGRDAHKSIRVAAAGLLVVKA
jgi:hypothetical protein